MCGYTILSIHHHIVLHAYKAEAQRLSNLEIGERWHKLYKSTLLTQESVKDKAFDEAQWLSVKEKLDEWRLELANIRRWMWALKPLARIANDENQCNGRFWAGLNHRPCLMKKFWPLKPQKILRITPKQDD